MWVGSDECECEFYFDLNSGQFISYNIEEDSFSEEPSCEQEDLDEIDKEFEHWLLGQIEEVINMFKERLGDDEEDEDNDF